MAYQAVGKIAIAVSNDLQTKEPKGTSVLIGNQANLSNLAVFMTFLETANTITEAYNQKMPIKLPDGERRPSSAFSASNLGPTVTGMAALLTLLKASTSTTNATFTAVDQAFISDLEADNATLRIVSTPYPTDLSRGSDLIAAEMAKVYAARTATAQALIKENSTKQGKDPYDPGAALKDVDAQLTALQSSLGGASGNSANNILIGAGLLAAVGAITPKTKDNDADYKCDAKYRILTFSNDVAGGGTRTNQIFLISFLFPWPLPSYNGGAVLSYTIRDQGGSFVAGGTLNHLYGYTKWGAPKADKGAFSNVR